MISIAATPSTAYSGLTSSDISADLQSEPVQPVALPATSQGIGDSSTQDRVTLSAVGLSRSQQSKAEGKETSPSPGDKPSSTTSSQELSPEDKQVVLKLKKRDTEVRTHEAAHLATAGQYAAGGPTYTYQSGPDGKRYAIGGEVPIDVSKEKTPEQTIQKMQTVRRAALAPANPSAADRNIAASASMKAAEARQELNSQRTSKESETKGGTLQRGSSQSTRGSQNIQGLQSRQNTRNPRPQAQTQFQAIYA